ncbi:MAG: hypothetical protein WCJ02_13330 [bacterium]
MIKSMRFISIFCIAVAWAVIMPSGALWAQDKVFGVTLTPPQREQFTAITDAAEPARKAIRENASLSEEEKRVQMKALYDGIREKLKAILTPAQRKEMEAAFSASAQGANKRFAVASSKIFGVTLTPSQMEQFKAFNAAAEPAKKAIRENSALSAEEKQAQMKTVYDGIREKVKSILTPAQLKEMEGAQKK